MVPTSLNGISGIHSTVIDCRLGVGVVTSSTGLFSSSFNKYVWMLYLRNKVSLLRSFLCSAM